MASPPLVLLPSLSDLAIAAVLLFASGAAVHRLTARGPMMWPVLGILPTLFFHLSHVHEWATAALASAGGTFPYVGMWLGGSHGVITANPANIEHMLKTNFANYPKGRYYRERFADFLGDGIFNADGQPWKDQRRAAAAEMHSPSFTAYAAGTIRRLVYRSLLPFLDSLATTDATVDLQDVLLRFTFDNICTAAFGVDAGCLAPGLPEVPFAKAFEQATELSLFRFIVPPFVWKLMKALDVGWEKQLKEAVKTVHEFAENTVAARRAELESRADRWDLLSRLMEAGREEGFKLSDKFLKDFCISFTLAGRDTSSVGLAWFFWLLHHHPHAESRIVDEIGMIVADRREQQFDDDIVFTVDELKRMEYLQAALSESLRLYPPVPINFKEAMEDDELPDGTRIKSGARVMYSIYSMGRTEGIWGQDCREFRPERWMMSSKEEQNQFKYAVFNGGPRLCVGKKFAYVQMKMVAAAVLRRYRVEVVEGQEVVPKISTTLYMRNGLRVRVRPRTGKE